MSQPDDHDLMQRRIGLAVAAAAGIDALGASPIPSMPTLLPVRCNILADAE